jgi:hypothetical protein
MCYGCGMDFDTFRIAAVATGPFWFWAIFKFALWVFPATDTPERRQPNRQEAD